MDENSKKWLVDNTDKWNCEGEEIIFLIPLEKVPPYVVKTAEAYKKACINSHKKMNLIHALGLSGTDEDWE